MVRVGSLRDDSAASLERHIRRVFPVIQGPSRWGSLVENRSQYFSSSNKFPLVQEPLLEAIPQYEEGGESMPGDMSDWEYLEGGEFSEQDARRMGMLGSVLQTSDKVTYNLYPHQRESVIAHLEERDVVVATGTGSGKTEAFLFPVVSHLLKEAIRCDGQESPRGVKAIILYPMNALVSDQMARMRDLLGDPRVAARISNSGFGRFPQFGMYTGRTPFHGWYATPNEDSGRYERERTATKMREFRQPYEESSRDPRLWQELLGKHKIPSIGGVVLFSDSDEDPNETITFDQLPPYVRRIMIDGLDGDWPDNIEHPGDRQEQEIRDSRFVIDHTRGIFGRISMTDRVSEGTPDHLMNLGDCLDRELIARHQMHLGGVRQYIEQSYENADPDQVISSMGVGMPDVLVTNYSMLEYMLMRPMEHVFWHKTREWMEETGQRLLLVVDEAHLYEGALGTEFSLLLNRLLSALLPDAEDMDEARERIQFIITSASLGTNTDASKDYASDLLSLNQERRERIWLPETRFRSFDRVPHEDLRIGREEIQSLVHASSRISGGEDRNAVELEMMREIIGDQVVNRIIAESSEYANNNDIDPEDPSMRRDRIARIVEEWPVAHRLRRLLLSRSDLSDAQSNDLAHSYENNQLEDPGDRDDRLPRRYGIISDFLFDEQAPVEALDLLLDIIASAHRRDERLPFLPIRAHLFVRGDTVSRICPRCGEMFSDGIERCTSCQSIVYDLVFDRNCGGSFIRLWWSSENLREMDQPLMSDLRGTPDLGAFQVPAKAWNSRNRDPASNTDAFLGVLAQVLDDDDPSHGNVVVPHSADFWLNTFDGTVTEEEPADLDQFVPIRVLARENSLRTRDYEVREGWLDPRWCPYCSREYTHAGPFPTPQFSNTQTRGDQFFNGLVGSTTGRLDPVPESPHAHRGRKMLVFSDSRQRAAEIATNLKSEQSVDQGRALFVHLHNQVWFQQLPEESRTIGQLYPYLCMMSASVRSNPLSDTSARPSRSRMLSHTALLMIHLRDIFVDRLGEMANLPAGMPEPDLEWAFEELSRKRLKSAFHRDISNLKSLLRGHRNTDQWGELCRRFSLDINRAKNMPDANFTTIVENYDMFNPDTLESFNRIISNDRYQEMRFLDDSTPEPDLRHVRETIGILQPLQNSDFLRIVAIKNQITSDPQIPQVSLLEEIANRTLSLLESGDILPEEISNAMQTFSDNLLPIEYPGKPPRKMGALVLRWLGDERFGTLPLGLGSLKIVDSKGPPEGQRGPMMWDTMAHALPLVFTDHRQLRGDRFRTSGRAIVGQYSDPDRSTTFPDTNSKWESYDRRPSSATLFRSDHDLTMEIGRALARTICGSATNEGRGGAVHNTEHPLEPEIRQALPIFVDWLVRQNRADQQNSILWIHNTTSETSLLYIAADSLVFEPMPIEGQGTPDSGRSCARCLTRRPDTHVNLQIACVECNSIEVIDLSEEADTSQIERASGYLSERLVPWHNMVSDLENPGRTMAVYRAEEHTAQISQVAEEGDGYTKTELHELMFMDIPVQSYIQDLETRYEQPPIDILSCTTTMEVGIDLGDLNAVALRTVPPSSANYQQRVGRAGRGSSEVSVALTWVDNSAYAQEFFNRPEILVTNPSDPPTLYLNNRKIRQRHLNAILFQRFFKRTNYSPVDLTFDGMQPGAGQLLQSLGSLEDFVQSDGQYGMDSFVDYVEEMLANQDSDELLIILSVCRTTPEEFADWARMLLNTMESWRDIVITEEESGEGDL